MTTAAHSVSPGDLSFLSSLLTSGTADAAKSPSGTTTQPKNKKQGRATMMDPLLIAAAGTHSTRMHFTHAFKPLSYASCDDERLALASSTVRPKMESRQAPRSVRVQVEEEEKRRKQLADEMKEQQLAAQKAVEGKPAAVVVPTQEGGFELKEDGKLAREQEKAGGGRKLSHGQVHELKKDAFVDLLRQPSTPPPLEHPLSSPPFATSAPSAVKLESPSLAQSIAALPPATDYSSPASTSAPSSSAHIPPLEVQCRVRTRIPTPHGHIFLHLYTNNHDTKEHLAFVADHAQMASTSLTTNAVEGTPIVAETRGQKLLPFIRSHSLDAKWHDGETDEERIVRGAYVGRLSADSHVASSANPHSLDPQASSHSHSSCSCPHPHAKLSTSSNSPTSNSSSASSEAPTDPPLVRIHSECLTGEIIGSQRCDCGEQLDEAFRLITLAGRGVVVYLRQEGRGIGLLEKMRAYNLQDLGHDTVTANLMLGHGADLRTYGVAGEILRDLGVADDGVRLLTNNPDKIRQIEKEGVRVRERVAMVPRSWMAVEEALARQARRRDRKKKRALERGRGPKNASATPSASVESSVASLIPSASSLASSSILPTRSPFISTSPRHSHSHSRSASPSSSSFVPSASASNSNSNSDSDSSDSDDDAASLAYHLRRAGVGMIGASTTASPELEKYLRTKIERMGHMLTAPANTPALVEENKRSPLSRRETAE